MMMNKNILAALIFGQITLSAVVPDYTSDTTVYPESPYPGGNDYPSDVYPPTGDVYGQQHDQEMGYPTKQSYQSYRPRDYDSTHGNGVTYPQDECSGKPCSGTGYDLNSSFYGLVIDQIAQFYSVEYASYCKSFFASYASLFDKYANSGIQLNTYGKPRGYGAINLGWDGQFSLKGSSIFAVSKEGFAYGFKHDECSKYTIECNKKSYELVTIYVSTKTVFLAGANHKIEISIVFKHKDGEYFVVVVPVSVCEKQSCEFVSKWGDYLKGSSYESRIGGDLSLDSLFSQIDLHQYDSYDHSDSKYAVLKTPLCITDVLLKKVIAYLGSVNVKQIHSPTGQPDCTSDNCEQPTKYLTEISYDDKCPDGKHCNESHKYLLQPDVCYGDDCEKPNFYKPHVQCKDGDSCEDSKKYVPTIEKTCEDGNTYCPDIKYES